MRLRAKALLIFGLTLPVMAAVLYFASLFLLHGFEQVEADATQQHVQLAARSLTAVQEDLGAITQEWSAWDDVANFVQDKNPDFPARNLTCRSLNKINVDMVAIYDNTQRLVYSGQRNDTTDHLLPLSAQTLLHLALMPGLIHHADANSTCQGMVALPEGLFVVSSRPILTSNYQGPVCGAFLFARQLTSARIAAIARRTRQDVDLHPLTTPARSTRTAEIIAALSRSDNLAAVIRPVDHNTVGGYKLVRDIAGQPIAILGIERERSVYNQGRATVYCLLILIAVFTLFCGAMTLFLLDRFILARIWRLNRCVTGVAEGRRPERSPTDQFPDELTLLSESVNDTLEALLRSQDHLKITQFSVDRAADPVIWIGPEAGIRYVNDAASRSLGYTRDELLSMNMYQLDPGITPEIWTARWAEISDRGSSVFEAIHRAKDGRLIPVEVTVTAMRFQGEECHCAFIRDITERKRSDERLRHAATHDALTGLPNRVLFTQHLDQAIALTESHPDYKFAVMFLDFDRFKIINDSLGHQAGDELLIAISEQLKKCLTTRETATRISSGEVARIGGDEFVILLEGVSGAGDAVALAHRIQEAVSKPIFVSGHQTSITVSMGIVASDLGYDSAADILRDADIAMYRAKAGGKARHVVFDHHMHETAVARLQLENDLRRAIEAQEITVAYQPIVALETGELEGFEALARWQHPTRGHIGPDDFIPIAEETGLILPLGRQVLRKSCRQWVRFRELHPEAKPVVMSVNVSKRQLLEPGLSAEIERLLDDLHMPPANLKLEVTESTIMQSADLVTPVLEDIKALGVKLAMDDFGQGHSSLGSLHRFPIDCLKIDKAFVTNMGLTQSGLNTEYTAIVHAVITLAHNLGMQVCAEGVETVAQLVQLQALGCDFGQGHYFSKVTPPEAAAALIACQTWLGIAATPSA